MWRLGSRLLIACIATASLAAPVSAGQFDDAVAAYSKKDYAKALRLWQPLAKKGDADAQFRLGELYFKGLGVRKDPAQAVKWYRQAADHGNPGAQVNLGYLYAQGIAVKRDYAQAAKWYRLAAARGNAMAQNNLGTLYAKGQGVPQDFVQARFWYNLAAAQGDRAAAVNRDKVATKMTAAQSVEAQRLASQWKPGKKK